jgi:AcrR family transcriptional regulator
MKKRAPPVISARKTPRQARSTHLVDAILEAASRVLAREGAEAFTTARVAEEAGVSVGSLYQYFPNKEALLFRLQADEWKETSSLFEEILADARLPPIDRLYRALVMFFRSEHEEAELRAALVATGAPYRDAPEAHARRKSNAQIMLAFMQEALPGASEEERAFAADFVATSVATVAKRITTERRSRAVIDRWAAACAETYCGYLRVLGARTNSR